MFERGALKVLKEDHKNLRKMLNRLKRTKEPADQERILREVAQQLLAHAKAEEQLFYPALENRKDKRGNKPVQRAYEEHSLAEKALTDLMSTKPGTAAFEAKVEIVRTLVIAHAKEEEMRLFRAAKKALDRDELEKLGEAIQSRKQSLAMEVDREIAAYVR